MHRIGDSGNTDALSYHKRLLLSAWRNIKTLKTQKARAIWSQYESQTKFGAGRPIIESQSEFERFC